ncbi:DUF4422 domain-containing protein [Lactobacillus delbrueckii]|uniref:DUF4422 domain-containing protein n=1 Tax=Lactobacillus delbrueckii TaxID=1584 RepID=UPI0001DC99B3|nr:DUF4422 domain-containing protein [Lactobacillus delbrueckii]EFK31174.1 hypothetical protein HMPREF9264_0741 [Lactobacillus delbrueckii subsp. bulgaricus PB2003/044-T3-4]
MKIFVITHKEFKLHTKDADLYQPMLVGAAIGNKGDSSYIRDNSGDNISSKNGSYCELTGIYWIWKNSKEDIVGIDHYRRYFVEKKSKFKQRYLTSEDIERCFKKYDIILPTRETEIYNHKSAKEFFIENHGKEVWNSTREIICRLVPEYVEDFDWFANQKTGYCYNMMICNKKIFDDYCDWLFKILGELEKETDLTKYSDYNKRMYGFVSERLVNVWIHNKDLRVKEYPVYFDDGRSLVTKIKDKLKNSF